MAAADFPRCPLADNFLYRGLVRVNAYKCAKFQVPSSISYRDMKGIPEYKVGAADLHRRPLAAKLLYVQGAQWLFWQKNRNIGILKIKI